MYPIYVYIKLEVLCLLGGFIMMKKLFDRKWLIVSLAIIVFATTALPVGPANQAAASICAGVTPGTTADCPIMIYDAPALNAMRSNLAGHYALGADIDLFDYLSPGNPGYNGGSRWVPVGEWLDEFSGSFNGNGHTISNLKTTSNAGDVGLFGATANAAIRNIGLINVDISGVGGTSNVGGLVGSIVFGTTIENTYVTGAVVGAGDVGGLVGYALGTPASPTRIRTSYASAAVTGTGNVGGLVGNVEGHDINISITGSYYNFNLTGFSAAGIGLTTAEMKTAASFSQWSFEEQSQWGILEGMTFPMHRTTLNQIVLDELTIDDGEIAYEPAFAAHTSTYSSRVINEVASVTVSVYASSSHVSVSIGGIVANSRVIPLNLGLNTIPVAVSTDVAVPGAATNPFETTYTLEIIRENGTDYPHRITTASQLAAIGTVSYALSNNYELMNDLDLTGVSWSPIGDGGQPFTGTFEGNRHVIRNLTVAGSNDDAGLFAASSGTIRNIGLENASVSGGARVGGLVGSNSGIISNAYVKGNVAGDEHVGGLVGLNSGAANVAFTYAAALVSGTDHTGGLIGETTAGVVSASYWDTEMSAHSNSDGGEGRTTAAMQLAATYSGWDFAGTWAIINETTYPMFNRHFDIVKLQALSATSTDASFNWIPAVFASAQGSYELSADRYIEVVTITAAPADSDTLVTIGSTASTVAQVAVNSGANVILIGTTGTTGKPDGVYRLTINVPAPEITGIDIPAPGYYGIGDALTFTVSYEGDVDVVNTPAIPIVVGAGADATTVYAAYTGQPPGEQNKLIFTYIVEEGLVYANDLEIGTHIQLPGGAEINAASTAVAAPLALPATITTDIVIDAAKPEITLTQQPESTVITADPVTVTAATNGTGSNIAVAKWSEGLRTADYFATDGHLLAGDSFTATANGTYSVYAEDQAGNSAVATIDISNLISESPQIGLSYSPTRASRSVTVTVTADVQGGANSVTSMNWLPGSHVAADFADGTLGTDILAEQQFTVTVNGNYTVYVKDAVGHEAVAEITISNIRRSSSDPEDADTTTAPDRPTPPATGPTITADADGGITLRIDPASIVKETLEDGTIIEHVALTNEMIEQVLELLGEAQTPFVTVLIDDTEQAVQVQLPAVSLGKVKDAYPDTVFEVKLNESSYQLPVNANFEPKAAHINVVIAKVAGQTKERLEQAVSNAGLKLVSNAVDYKVIVSTDGQTAEVSDFGRTYIIRAIVPNESISGERITAVLFDPATGTLSFVPAVTAARADGTPEITIKAPHNSIYAIMASAHKSFADLDGHWAKAHVDVLASKLIVSGVTGTEFAPDSSITRAEFTALLVRAAGLKVERTASDTLFEDVSGDDWFAPAVAAGVRAGLIRGMSDNAFAPEADITREQMAVMLANAFKLLGYPELDANRAPIVLGKFDDRADISAWATSAVAQSVEAGFIFGVTNDTIAPSDTATRAQAAVMLRRFLQHVKFID